MDTYPFTLDQVVGWLKSTETQAAASGVHLAQVRASRGVDKPSASADFDSPSRIGQIAFWVSGEIDYEILRVTDGATTFIKHQTVATLDDDDLRNGLSFFFAKMMPFAED